MGNLAMALPNAPETASPDRSAVLLVGEGEMRVLLRGLLRLSRFRVVGEAATWEEARRLLAAERPGLLLVDEPRDAGALLAQVAAERGRWPRVRLVVITAAARVGPMTDGADANLPRPFRLRDFARAIDPAGLPPDRAADA